MRVQTAIACAFTLTASAGAVPAQAEGKNVTFTSDVAPIVFEHCLTCHRPGEVAPMSLSTYEEARPWAKAIKEKVSSRAMPPWFANPDHGTFGNDATLSESEIATIVAWVDQGVKQGNPDNLPPLPVFSDGWQLGEPDFIVDLPEVNVPADGDDYFPDLALTIDIPEKRWIRAVEVRPGNREVAHHIVLFSSGGGQGSNGFFDVLAVWAVGTPATEFPDGMGRWVYPGQRITTNMHYHPNGTATTDQSRIGLYFGDGEMKKEINSALAGTMTFNIPAGAANHPVKASHIVDQDIRVVSYFPHMHLRGKSMRLTAAYPDGSDEILLDVPEYDFDWQLFYNLEKPFFLPAGTRVDILAHYDNSEDNPNNPDPTRAVGFGQQSTDEMMFGFFDFVADEGVAPAPVSDKKRIQTLLSTLPSDSVYDVKMKIRNLEVPTCLHLPREGDGVWYIPFMRQLLNLAVTDIEWAGNDFSFAIRIQLGGMGVDGTFNVTGSVDDAGNIRGDFALDEAGNAASFLPFKDFSGSHPQATVGVGTD
jgi:hypothetical protein